MSTKCKIETPSQLPESGLSRVQFKSWKEGMIVYLKQNEDYHHFLPGGAYEKWKSEEEYLNRIENLAATEVPAADATNAATVTARDKLLAKRRRDLNTMLSIIARKVDQYDFDDVMKCSTSVGSIWEMIELVYDIGRKGVHFLQLGKIKYESGESPVKYYKKIYHHFMDNLYKNGDVLEYKGTQMTEDEKLSPTLLNFILYYTIENIDSRLMKKIKDKWGHILDKDKCLHDLKDIILKLSRIFSPNLKPRILKLTLLAPFTSLQHSLHGVGEGPLSEEDPLLEEDLDEVVQVSLDLGRTDGVENSVDYAKPQGAQEESTLTTTSMTAQSGPEKMWKISG